MNKKQRDVLGICNAYEDGMGHGLENRTELKNPYTKDSDEYVAWAWGFQLGQSRRKEVPSE